MNNAAFCVLKTTELRICGTRTLRYRLDWETHCARDVEGHSVDLEAVIVHVEWPSSHSLGVNHMKLDDELALFRSDSRVEGRAMKPSELGFALTILEHRAVLM